MKQIEMGMDTRSLAERVAYKIEELIQDGVFAPGDKLPNEYDLSQMLQVGRSTVRESIKILESRNVTKIRRGFGTYVCHDIGISHDPFGLRFMGKQEKLSLDLSEMRMMLEPNIARLAAKNATDTDIAEIQQACDEVADLIRQKKNYAQKDMEFHTRIAESTDNLVIPRVIPIICSGIGSYVEITQSSRAGNAIITHQRIVDAICAHDEEEAFAAMTEHLRENRSILLRLPDEKS